MNPIFFMSLTGAVLYRTLLWVGFKAMIKKNPDMINSIEEIV